MRTVQIRLLSLFLALFLPAIAFGQTRTEVANIGNDNETTIYGPTYAGAISLLTAYNFEVLYLAEEINLTADGELTAIEFYVTGGVDLDLLGGATVYLKTTSQSSFSDGTISDPSDEGYTEVNGSFSLLGLGLSGGDIVRFELDDGFPVEQGDNIALHTRQNITVGASLGSEFYATNATDLTRAGTVLDLLGTGLLGDPEMEVRDLRPNARLEFETEFELSAANSIITAQRPQILADGESTTLVTLQARTNTGENVNSGGDSVQFSTTNGTISSANDNGDGTYTAVLTSANSPGTATVTATINGSSVGDDAQVEFVDSLADLYCTDLQAHEEQIGTITSATTPRGPLFSNLASLTLGTYQFETIYLQNELNLEEAGFLNAIEFYVDSDVNVDALGDVGVYIKETTQNSLSDGDVSLDDYTFVAGNSSLLSVNVDGQQRLRIEFETPFFYSNNGNLAIHTRHFILADADVGGQFHYTTANVNLTKVSQDLIGLLGITVGLTEPETTSQRPDINFDFDLLTTADLSVSTLAADPDRIPADGSSTSTITSLIRTADGGVCVLEAGAPEFETTAGTLGSVSHEGDGEYTALLTSSTTPEIADIRANIDGSYLDEEAEVEFFLLPPSPEFTTIEADPASIQADGSSTSEITVTLRDENDNPVETGGYDVTLSTTAGTLSSVTDNNDGTYTATLTSSTSEEIALITGTLEGDDIQDSAEVNFFLDELPPSPEFTTIEADPTSILADGSSTSLITVTLRDDNNDPIEEGGFEVVLSTTAGTLDDVNDNNDGTYTAVLTSSTEEETAVITGTLEGDDINDQAEVEFVFDQTPDPGLSTVEASPRRVPADGASTSTVTVTLRNSAGQQLSEGGDNVTLSTTAGSLGGVTDNNDGTYTATLTAPGSPDVATISATINGDPAGNEAKVTFFDPGTFVCEVSELDYEIGNGSTTTSRGPLLNATASLLVSDYQFEAIYLQDEIDISNSGQIRYIDFFVTSEIDLSAVSDVSVFLKETSETTLPDGDVPLDDYTEVTGDATLLSLNVSGSDILRIELDEPFEYSNTANLAVHTRSNILLSASLGGNFLASDTGENRTRVSEPVIGALDLVVGVTTPEATSTRPDVRFTIDVRNVPDPATSLISANPNQIAADGESTSMIEVELFNCLSEPITEGGDDVELFTTAGNLSDVTDNDDGTYSAVLTSSTTEETATITGEVNSEEMEDDANVEFVADPVVPSPEFTTIEADPTSIQADGSSTSEITVTLRDENDDPVTTGGFDVTLSTTAGSLSNVTDNGDGTYNATLTSSTEEEVAEITGTLEGDDIQDSAEVEFFLDEFPPSPEFTTIEADPTSILADGSSTSEITVTLRDENDDPVTTGGFDVTLSTTAGSLSNVTDNGDGTYNATLTSSTTPETAVITGTLEGDEIQDSAEVEFTMLPPSAEFTTIEANPEEIEADGESTSTITVTLRNANDEPVETGGYEVTLSTTAGSLGGVTDNGDGTYTAILTSSTDEETAVITGTLEGDDIQDSAEVDFVDEVLPPDPAFTTIEADPTSILADGESTSDITVILRNENGNRVGNGGFEVTLSTTAGSLSDVTDNGDGSYSAVLTSSTEVGTAVISGTLEGDDIQDTAEVEFTALGPSPEFTTIEADPASIDADGESTSTITVTLRDANDEPVETGGYAVTLSTTAGSLGDVTDNGDGTYNATLTSSTEVETAVITGTLEGDDIQDSAEVEFTMLPPDPEFTTIDASPTTILADGESTSTVTVTLNNRLGNPVGTGGFEVELFTTAGSLGDVTDNGDGTYNAILTSSTEEEVAEITGTLEGEDIQDSAEVSFEFDVTNPSPEFTTIEADPTDIPADGESESAITVTFYDDNNERITEGGFCGLVVLSTTDGSLGGITDNDDGTCTVILTSSENPGTAVITGTLDGDEIQDTAEVEFTMLPPSAEFTTIEANPEEIEADGESTSTITVTLRNANDEPVETGGYEVTLSTTAGSLGGVTDNGDGTYTAILTSSTDEETAVITGTLEGDDIQDSAEVDFVDEVLPPDPAFTTIEADPTSILADGESTSDITVILRNENGNRVGNGGFEVTLSTTAGSLSDVTDNGDGSYSAVLTSSTEQETAVISGTLEGEEIEDTAEVEFTALGPSPEFTTIEADPATINADGESTSTITVTLYDANGDRVETGGYEVELFTTAGTLGNGEGETGKQNLMSDHITDNGDGTYTAILTSSTNEETAVITGTLEGDEIQDSAEVEFILEATQPFPDDILIDADPTEIPADGVSTSTITVTLIDDNGDRINEGGFCGNVELSTTLGTLSEITDQGDGTCTATLTSSEETGTAVVSGEYDGEMIDDTAEIVFLSLEMFQCSVEKVYPNPFMDNATFQVTSPMAGEINLELFDVLGQKVATITDQEVTAGEHEIQFNGSNLSSGVYIYRYTCPCKCRSVTGRVTHMGRN